MSNKADFETVFLKLKAILEPYAPKLVVSTDTKKYYCLETSHIMKNKHRLYFAGVRLGKNYVSFYLMPVYACSELIARMSPELKKRMQGKSCFNFTDIDPAHLQELAAVTKKGFAGFIKQFP